jgi:hypothetical protein
VLAQDGSKEGGVFATDKQIDVCLPDQGLGEGQVAFPVTVADACCSEFFNEQAKFGQHDCYTSYKTMGMFYFS